MGSREGFINQFKAGLPYAKNVNNLNPGSAINELFAMYWGKNNAKN